MKIVAVLDTSIINGGGFNQALNALLQMKRLCENRFEFLVVTTFKQNVQLLEDVDIKAAIIKHTLRERLFLKLMLLSFFKQILNRYRPGWLYPFEKKLKESGADLVYFVLPSSYSLTLRSLNFIYTVMDNCHRDTPEFPEVRQFGRFHDRELLNQQALPQAFLVLTDSDVLADNISRRYGIDKERFLTMPFGPSPIFKVSSALSVRSTLEKYKLEQGYFFYPAQFWSHKNHIRILEALIILQKRDFWPRLVFVGGDQGNLSIIELFIQKNSLQGQVNLLGFVPPNDMQGLYEGCRAVVMPTYFGPTNMPPLEAWLFSKPLIYSAHLKEQQRMPRC
jgi:glycosyltransferase involved in cell wall biosynthesis